MSEASWAVVRFFWACLTGVALLVLIASWRGRRFNAAATCKRCGFSVHNLRSLARCPECGSELPGGGIAYGERQKNPRAVRLAGLALIICLAAAAIDVGVRIMGSDWNKLKPVWMLANEARGKNPVSVRAALYSLKIRSARGDLAPSDYTSLLAVGLACQRDAAAIWEPAWGDFIEAARATGHVSDEEWSGYLRTAIGYRLRRIPRSGSGPPAVGVSFGPARLGSGRQLRVEMTATDEGETQYIDDSRAPRLLIVTSAAASTAWISPLPDDAGTEQIDALKSRPFRTTLHLRAGLVSNVWVEEWAVRITGVWSDSPILPPAESPIPGTHPLRPRPTSCETSLSRPARESQRPRCGRLD